MQENWLKRFNWSMTRLFRSLIVLQEEKNSVQGFNYGWSATVHAELLNSQDDFLF